MITKKRDQRQYDLVQQYLPGLILNTILGIICELGDPYDAKPGLGGMTAYPPSAMAAVCIMLEAGRTTYRKMVGIPRNNHAMATKMGLTKIPSKSTIARSYGLIPEWYLVHVHQTVIREVEAGSLAGASTGFSYLRFVRWFDIRADKFRTKKGWVKMHAIVDIRTRVIIDYLVTDSVAADINGLYVMLRRLGLGMGHVLPGFCIPGKGNVQHDICHGHGAAHQAQIQYRAQRQGKPAVARDGRLVHGRQGDVRLRVPPAQRHRVSLCRAQEDVRGPHGAAGRTTGQGRSRSAPHATTSSSWPGHR